MRIHAIYVTALLAAMTFFNLADQTVLGAVLGSIQGEFHLGDTALGLTASAFTVALALGAIPLGYWADRGSRRLVIGLGVAVWSLATLATGLSQSFVQLLAARGVVGIGEASQQPATASLIGDYFTDRARGRAMSIIVGVGGLGLGGGLILGGVVGTDYGWRAAFFAAAGPGLLLALLARTIREPLRGAAEGRGPQLAVARDAGFAAFRRFFRNRTYLAAMGASAVSGFGFSVLAFGTLYVQRKFGLDAEQAAELTGAPLLAGVVLMTPLAGWLIDRRARRSPRAAVELGTGGMLLAAAAALLAFAAPSMPLFLAGLLIGLLGQAMAVLTPVVIQQNVILPSLRASAAALNLTFGRLFGSALGPLVVGALSDLFGRNLEQSMILLVPTAFLLGAACLVWALDSIQRDTVAMEGSWAAHEPDSMSADRPLGLSA